jgi:hypothetical protein
LLGELQDGQTVNLLVAPEWHQVRLVVVEAMRDYPEARPEPEEPPGPPDVDVDLERRS